MMSQHSSLSKKGELVRSRPIDKRLAVFQDVLLNSEEAVVFFMSCHGATNKDS